eukprot:scaffold685_cov281-Pinguiococcus_pyrenoidosus.AAC.5
MRKYHSIRLSLYRMIARSPAAYAKTSKCSTAATSRQSMATSDGLRRISKPENSRDLFLRRKPAARRNQMRDQEGLGYRVQRDEGGVPLLKGVLGEEGDSQRDRDQEICRAGQSQGHPQKIRVPIVLLGISHKDTFCELALQGHDLVGTEKRLARSTLSLRLGGAAATPDQLAPAPYVPVRCKEARRPMQTPRPLEGRRARGLSQGRNRALLSRKQPTACAAERCFVVRAARGAPKTHVVEAGRTHQQLSGPS